MPRAIPADSLDAGNTFPLGNEFQGVGGTVTIGDTAIAAGWYKDPAGSHSLRWWDGTQWTNHLRLPDPTPVTREAVVPALPVIPLQTHGVTPGVPGVDLPPVQAAANHDAYSTGAGFGGENGSPARGNDPYSNGSFAPSGPVNNTIAWVGLGAGILSIGVVFYLLTAPSGNFYVPFFGLTAIIASIRALTRRRSGRVTVLWAPLAGLILGGVSEIVVVVLLIAGGFLSANASASNSSPTTIPGGASSQAAVAPPTLIGPVGQTTSYFAGNTDLKYLPKNNADLAAALRAEHRVVTAIEAEYSGGTSGSAEDGKWPTTISGNATTGDVTSSDGKDLGALLPNGFQMVYDVTSDGSFVLGVSGSVNNEMALYVSHSNHYVTMCQAGDENCNTHSPYKPVNATLSQQL